MDSTFLVTEARLGPFRIGLSIDHFSNWRFRARAGCDLKSFFAPGCWHWRTSDFRAHFGICEIAIFYPSYPTSFTEMEEVYLDCVTESRSEEIRRDFLHRSSLNASPSARSLVYWLLLLLFSKLNSTVCSQHMTYSIELAVGIRWLAFNELWNMKKKMVLLFQTPSCVFLVSSYTENSDELSMTMTK